MADVSFSLEQETYSDNFYSQDKNVYAQKKKSFKMIFIKICLGIFICMLIAEVVFSVLIMPAVSSAVIDISGGENLSVHEIKKISGLTGTVKWLNINSSVISRRLVSFPLIASATVEKKFPDKVIIKITERKPVAIAFAQINGRTVPMEIDKDGVVFRIGSSLIPQGLPIITGLTFENPAAGMKINKQLTGLFVQLDVLKRKQPLLLNEISEIKIAPIKYGGYDLIVYPVKARFPVITNKSLTEDTIRYMMLLIDVANDSVFSHEICEMDIRGPNVAYKKRGEQK